MLRLLSLGLLCAANLVQQTHATAPLPFLEPAHRLHERTTSTSPVIKNNFPDPCLIPATPNAQDSYYAFATRTIGSPVNVQVAHTANFSTGPWTILNSTSTPSARYDALPTLPAWVAPQPNAAVWAPDVSRLPDGSYILYFAAATKANGHHCIGAARSPARSGVRGPYVPDPNPLVCPLQQGGAIDPAGFVDSASGKRYLAYKVDGNSIGRGGVCGNSVAPIVPTPLVLQPVSAADGTTFAGAAVTLLDNAGAADDGVVEAPSLARGPGGAYFLLFSSGCFSTTRYTVSYAVSTAGVAGPYKRVAQPLLKAGVRGLRSPGGASIFWQKDPSAEQRKVVFHDGPLGQRVMYSGLATLGGGKIVL